MERPKTIPENIWEAAELIAQVLRRKSETPLDIEMNPRLRNATGTTTKIGGYNGGRQNCHATAGGTPAYGCQ